MADLVLEIDMDLPMEPDDVERYHAYIADGMEPFRAAVQVAQDILGGNGAMVQRAEVVPC